MNDDHAQARILPIRTVVARHVAAVYAELGSKAATARALGIHVRTVYRYLAAVGVSTDPLVANEMLASNARRRAAERIGGKATIIRSAWL